MPEPHEGDEMKMMPVQQSFMLLPRADAFGNFWFGNHKGDTPAIFKRMAGEKEERPVWMLSLGAGGIVFDGGQIREYATVIEAFEDLKRLVGG